MLTERAMLWSLKISASADVLLRCVCTNINLPTLISSQNNVLRYSDKLLGSDEIHNQQFLFVFPPSVDCELHLTKGDYELFGASYAPRFLSERESDSSILKELMTGVRTGKTAFTSRRPVDLPERARILIEQVMKLNTNGLQAKHMLQSRSSDLLSIALQRLSIDRQFLNKEHSADEDRLRDLHDWIVGHLDYNHSLTSLSQRVGLNISKMQRMFHRLYGKSTISFVRHLKLERARKQLEETYTNIKSISSDSGYRSVSAFTQAFKAVYAISPSALRSGSLRKIISLNKVTKSR